MFGFLNHHQTLLVWQILEDATRNKIPRGIGVYVNGDYMKKVTKKDIDNNPQYEYCRSVGGRSTKIYILYTDMLKESMIRSLY